MYWGYFMNVAQNFESSFLKINTLTVEQQKKLKNIIESPTLNHPGNGPAKELMLRQIFSDCLQDLGHKFRGIILQLNSESSDLFSFDNIHQINAEMGALFGELLVQNEQGDKIISVYDRNRLGSMNSGSRYHQTREGGSIHTDNVNVPEMWDYLVLSCISPAFVGGENILVDGLKIHHILKNSYPEALRVLEQNFTWEMRGFAEALYYAPIITYDANHLPLFRHLRPYMESAHHKAMTPLNEKQLFALDVLDALTNSSENQVRFRMKKGDILLTVDAQVLHGRTCFSDALEAVTLEQFHEGQGGPILKRTMERLWIKKH